MQVLFTRRATLTAAVSLFTLIVTSGCGGSSGTAPASPTLSSATASQLRTAPEAVTLPGGQTLRLSTYLWRDFQPVSPVDGKPLIAVFRVATADQTPLPTGTRVDAAWVVFGDEVWNAQPVEEQPRESGSPSLEVVGRNGPKWGPNASVDVIVQVRDDRNATYRLQAPQQPIARTD
jgi:hypothetical protein